MSEPLITNTQLQATVDSEFAYRHAREARELIQAFYRQARNAVLWAEDMQKRVTDPIIGADLSLQAKISASMLFFSEVIVPAWAAMNDPKFAPLVSFVPNEQATYQPPPPLTPEQLALQAAQQAVADAQAAVDLATVADPFDQGALAEAQAALAEAQAALNALIGGA